VTDGLAIPRSPEAVEPTLVTVGDVIVTQSWVVTPSGTRARREVSWTVTPMYQTSTGIPTWAIVCAIIFFVFCLLGLLFLLAKEQKTTGHMQVTVQSPGFIHTTYVPVSSPMQANDVADRVNYARALV
jgi:hypothetical protein